MTTPPVERAGSGIDVELVLKRMNEVIAQAMVIEKSIGDAGQPASRLELERLKQLGLEYGQLHRQLAQHGQASTGNRGKRKA